LADGKTLVTHVMPSALLEQSRDVLRNRFSAIVTKKIYTLQFERGCADDHQLVLALYKKLNSAKTSKPREA
jgi:hypothetical protein